MTPDLHELTMELAKAVIYSAVGLLFAISTTSVGILFWMWIDVRNLKRQRRAHLRRYLKNQRSSFNKIRKLEKKCFGAVTSELDDIGQNQAPPPN